MYVSFGISTSAHCSLLPPFSFFLPVFRAKLNGSQPPKTGRPLGSAQRSAHSSKTQTLFPTSLHGQWYQRRGSEPVLARVCGGGLGGQRKTKRPVEQWGGAGKGSGIQRCQRRPRRPGRCPIQREFTGRKKSRGHIRRRFDIGNSVQIHHSFTVGEDFRQAEVETLLQVEGKRMATALLLRGRKEDECGVAHFIGADGPRPVTPRQVVSHSSI